MVVSESAANNFGSLNVFTVFGLWFRPPTF